MHFAHRKSIKNGECQKSQKKHRLELNREDGREENQAEAGKRPAQRETRIPSPCFSLVNRFAR
jgi:hypothetical protein